MPAHASRAPRLAVLLLLGVTMVWGSTFFLIRDLVGTAPGRVPSADFLAVRFAIAAIALFAIFHRQTLALARRDVYLGLGAGLLYGAAQLLQTVGLEHTDASVSGFVTGTYVVLTPILGAVILRDRMGWHTWVAAVLATVGLAILSLKGFHVGFGELLTLAAAALYALHIILLGRYSTVSAALGLSTLQAAVIAVVCSLAAAPDGITLPSGAGQWGSTLYMAVAAGALALWAQTWAQAHLTASKAAIVMAMEPVFAALFAVLSGQERPTARMVVGGAFVLSAMYLTELVGGRTDPGASALEDPPTEAIHHDV